MGIVGVVGMLVVHAMDRDPVDGRTLPAADAENGEAVFEPRGTDEAAMREQAVVADVDAERAEQVKSRHGPDQTGPAKQPGNTCGECQRVKR